MFNKEYFVFTANERRGVWILSILVGILFVVRVSLAQRVSDNVADTASDGMNETSVAVADSLSAADTVRAVRCREPRAGNVEKYPRKREYVHRERQKLYIELNSADTTELKKLRGIGSGFAGRIVRFRDKLGGFYSKEQLREVYGLSEETYQLCADEVWVDTSLISRLDVNTLGIVELKRHPYITFYQAKAIYEYRNTLPDKTIRSIDELSDLPDVAPDWERIRHYLFVLD